MALLRFVVVSPGSMLLLLGLSLFQGCGQSGTISDVTDGDLGLTATNEQTLTQVQAQYAELAKTQTPADARKSLLDMLNTGSFGVQAELSSDGTTIRLEFSDGSISIIDTDETAQIPVDPAVLDAFCSTFAKSVYRDDLDGRNRKRTAAKDISAALDITSIATPSSKRVKIIGGATASNPSLLHTIDHVKDALIECGWGADDIDVYCRTEERDSQVRSPAATEDIGSTIETVIPNRDRTVIPDDYLELSGYGLVIIFAHGGVWESTDGNLHFHLQCSPRGKYRRLVGEERVETYRAWVKEGKLTLGTCHDENGNLILDWWIRDDLLREQMKLNPGTIVHIVSCNSWNLQDEFTSAKSGDVWGWEGSERWIDGSKNIIAMIWKMGGKPALTDEESLADLSANGLAVSRGHLGEATHLKLASDSPKSYLPTWGKFTALPDDLPDEAVSLEVALKYPGVSDKSFKMTMTPGEDVNVKDLLPIDAVISLIARDKDGKVVGTGLRVLRFNSGLNEVALETCTADVTVQAGECPPGTANVHVVVTCDDPNIPKPDPFDIVPPNQVVLEKVFVTSMTFAAEALDAKGTVLAQSETKVNLECGENEVTLPFGWAKVTASEYPSDTVNVKVSAIPDDPNLPKPADVEFAPTASASLYGLALGSQVKLSAKATGSVGQPVGQGIKVFTVAAGENRVAIPIINYGIILEASPARVSPDGQAASTITATLKRWTKDDVLAPTGDPVTGKAVSFDTTLGNLVGTNPVISDSQGVATIQVTSTETGTARLKAFVLEDVVENYKICEVIFSSVSYGILVSANPAQVKANGVATSTVTVTLKRFKSSDGTVPTGDPVAGKEVTFTTDCGTLVGVNPVTTDAKGEAAIQIRSATTGTATVTAHVLGEDQTGTGQVRFIAPELANAFVSGSTQWDDPDPYFYVTGGACLVLLRNGEAASWPYDHFSGLEPYHTSDSTYHYKISFLDDKQPYVGDEIGVDLASWGTAPQRIGALYVHYQKGGEHYCKKLCDGATFSGASPAHFSVVID